VIHDWPDDDAVRILGNVRTAAGVGKHVLLVELVIPDHGREFMVTGWIWKCWSLWTRVSAPPPNTANCCAKPVSA
jgi:hypothetical protein